MSGLASWSVRYFVAAAACCGSAMALVGVLGLPFWAGLIIGAGAGYLPRWLVGPIRSDR